MTTGLTLPFVTASDPDRVGEGSIDPLGLARIADKLADALVPEVTARMSRVRFVTAIAICSRTLDEPAELTAQNGAPAYLAFEWVIVEALARALSPSETWGVPGIGKARSRLHDWRRHLDGASYLQTPKVFGFHGVYKRLARDLAIVDSSLMLLGHGEALVQAWERDQRLDGFSAKRRGSRGGKLATRLSREVVSALGAGSVQIGHASRIWRELSEVFAPGSPGLAERRRLWEWLQDPRYPVRREVAGLVAADRNQGWSERESVKQLLASKPSAELRSCLKAIDAFEDAVRPLDDGFQLLRSVASQRIPSMVAVDEVADHPRFLALANAVPRTLEHAMVQLEKVGLGTDLEMELGSLAETMPRDHLVERILDRHDAVQESKGKRAWFERDDRGFTVRGIGRYDREFVERVDYLHPYRIDSLRSFATDLRPA